MTTVSVSISKIDLHNANENYSVKNGELRLEPCRKPSEDCITCQWFHVFNDGEVMHVGKKDMGARSFVADTDVVALVRRLVFPTLLSLKIRTPLFLYRK